MTIKATFMKIMTSAWYRRLWTLQEAILSENLAILFKEGFAPLPELLNQAAEAPQHFEDEHWDPVHMVILREIRQLGLHMKNLDIGKVSSMLSIRNSSRRGDGSLAIAPLLGVDVQQLVDSIDAPARMRVFCQSVKDVPLNILTTDNPRLQEPGARALPSTMMGIQTWRYLDPYDKTASVTTCGLDGEYWVGRLPTPIKLSTRSAVFVRESQTQASYCVWPYRGEGYPSERAITFNAVCHVKQPLPGPDGSRRTLAEFRAAALLLLPNPPSSTDNNTFSFMGLLNADVVPLAQIDEVSINTVEIRTSRECITVTCLSIGRIVESLPLHRV